jgi:hypothetical protein
MRHLAAIAMLFSCACADRRSPVEPTPAVPAPVLVTFTLAGSVSDTANRPLSGASVTVVNGPRAGTIAVTDGRGRFSMDGSFTQTAVTLVASKDGYKTETSSLPFFGRPLEAGNWSFGFSLEPLAPSANLAGEYTLTVTTDRACSSLPDAARTRTYRASIVSRFRSTRFFGTLSDARFVFVPDSAPYFEIGVADDFASMELRFVEQLADASYLAVQGGIAAPVGPTGITGPFNAYFVHCRNQPSWSPGDYWWCGADAEGNDCGSVNNHLALVRR